MKGPRWGDDAPTAAEWAASFRPLSAPVSSPDPAPWQREALAALTETVPPSLLGLPLVVDRNVPPTVLLWAAHPGRTPPQIRAVLLLVDDQVD